MKEIEEPSKSIKDDGIYSVIRFYKEQMENNPDRTRVEEIQKQIKDLRSQRRTKIKSKADINSNYLIDNRIFDLEKLEEKESAEVLKFDIEVDLKIREYIDKESGLNDIPEKYRDKVRSYAWERGHSGGYGEYYNVLCGILDAIFDEE